MTVQTGALSGPRAPPFWGHFETLTKIPRPSRHEEPVIEHVRAWADDHGYELEQDSGRNLVIRVPATAGRESAPVLILQGHLDMVCERDPSSPNDPAEGRIALVRDGEWLTADGTTLGADDGVAIAAMMALAEDESLPTARSSSLMTVAEEVGLEGANALDGSLVTGSILVNLDSEEDGRLTVGCAGSTDTWVRHRCAARAGRGRRRVARGHCERAARRALGQRASRSDARTRSRCSVARSREAHATVPFRLVSLDGGKSRNAIPRDAARRRLGRRRERAAFGAAIGKAAGRSATRSRRPMHVAVTSPPVADTRGATPWSAG